MNMFNSWEVRTLGDVVISGMANDLPFTVIRTEVGKFLRDQGHIPIGTDRIGEGAAILVTYWSGKDGAKVSESFDEWPSYTKAQPISAW